MADDGKSDAALFSLRGIAKSYGAVQALAGIDLDVFPGDRRLAASACRA